MRHVNFSIKQVLTAVCAFSIIGYSAALCGPLFTQIDVFRSDTDGYHTYRIPAIIVSKEGTVLAFCEGRKKGRSDTGDIDLVLKRSFDNGRTWQPMKIIWDDGENVCGNPCPVVDRERRAFISIADACRQASGVLPWGCQYCPEGSWRCLLRQKYLCPW